MIEVSSSILKKVYRPRSKYSKKGDFGKLLIIGGNQRYSGAPALAAYAAIASLRSGVDIVMVVAPKRAANIVASFSPNLITEPIDGKYFTPKHVKPVLDMIKKFDAVCIGSGLGTEKETSKFVNKLLDSIKKPCVVDADAIKALKNKELGNNFVLTPHSYEFYDLTGEKPKMDMTSRIKIVEKVSKKIRSTILLKGVIDIISDGKQTAINRTGNPYMTTGGTGDVLTGICGSLLAQGNKPFDSACAAAFITGRAGDLAAVEKKQGLLATDVIEKIPEAVA
ncbi:MAG: NAD(P)H-hydrate dehydratase [Candidatus Aenigmarchaeota archaeon]|nr:NAD(P)H-hydrate dehydratase [Candidatus Aenigmarchaeota archaeon]